MTSKLLLYVDWGRGVWVLQFRNEAGELVSVPTEYPASMPSIVVSDAVQASKPGAVILATA